MSRVVCETWDPPIPPSKDLNSAKPGKGPTSAVAAGPRFWVAQRFQRCEKRPTL
jgi:hypothetical protein